MIRATAIENDRDIKQGAAVILRLSAGQIIKTVPVVFA